MMLCCWSTSLLLWNILFSRHIIRISPPAVRAREIPKNEAGPSSHIAAATTTISAKTTTESSCQSLSTSPQTARIRILPWHQSPFPPRGRIRPPPPPRPHSSARASPPSSTTSSMTSRSSCSRRVASTKRRRSRGTLPLAPPLPRRRRRRRRLRLRRRPDCPSRQHSR